MTVAGRVLTSSRQSLFIPTQLPGCVLWLRADQGITLATGVSLWLDQSGTGLTFSQGIGSKQPTLNVTDPAYNNQSTLSFVAAALQVLPATLALALPYTWIVVGNVTTGGTQSFVGTSNANLGSIYSSGTTAAMYSSGAVISGYTLANNKQSLIAAQFTATVGTLYINSSSAVAATGAITGGAMASTFLIGATSGGLGVGDLNGKIAEVIVYNTALSQAQLSQVFSYLGTRYGQVWS